ncbi:MAG: hypothetical protein ACXADO_00600 [Candidatus Thorarchaeota archaeon]|jgi:hypothetical protein
MAGKYVQKPRVAKYDGYCKYCSYDIMAGDEIMEGKKGWGHADCVKENGDALMATPNIPEFQYTPAKGTYKKGKYDGWVCAICGKHHMNRWEAGNVCCHDEKEKMGLFKEDA